MAAESGRPSSRRPVRPMPHRSGPLGARRRPGSDARNVGIACHQAARCSDVTAGRRLRNRCWGRCPAAGRTWGCSRAGTRCSSAGRAGPSVPRVPTSITMPGGTYQGPQRNLGIAAPQPLPVPQPPFYGTLEVANGPEDQGPPDGLTLDQAIEIYVHQNLDLRAQCLEMPQASADVLTASLRANPILYADSQLVPYGSFNTQRPGGPTQYDLNISHPDRLFAQATGPDDLCGSSSCG